MGDSRKDGYKSWKKHLYRYDLPRCSYPPTLRQLAYLRGLGYAGATPATSIKAAELIEELRIEPDTFPPTEKQIEFLRRLGHSGPTPTSRREASNLIDEIKRRIENRAIARPLRLPRRIKYGLPKLKQVRVPS